MLIEPQTEVVIPAHDQTSFNDLITSWKEFFSHTDWHDLIKDHEALSLGCGTIYEIGNPLGRPNEDCAIADMRAISYAEPHYHPTGNYEFYFMLEGTAKVVVGYEQFDVTKGDVILIPPNTAHFTIPDDQCVLAAICTPPFKLENYIPLTVSNKKVQFDYELFTHLTQLNMGNSSMRTFKQNKLWRDKAVSMMEGKHGSRIEWHRLDDASFDKEIRVKLLEEAQEIVTANEKNELIKEIADVYEVIDSLCKLHSITKEDIYAAQIKKRNERGGFDERMFVDVAHHPKDSFGEKYCLADPEKYPEIISE